MRPARGPRLSALCCAVLAGTAVLTAGMSTPVSAAAPSAAAPRTAESSASVEAQVEQLRADVERVGEELAEGARAYEVAEAELARLTQSQFTARSDRDALLAAEGDARGALHGLARAAYKGGVPPMMTALLTGDPRALSDLAYVQRSVNRLGATHNDVTRELVLQQTGAGEALQRSDELRREALAQRQALEVQRGQLAARTTELTAELTRAGARLVRARAAEELAALEKQALASAASAASAAAAQRTAELTAEAAGVPYVPGAVASTSGGNCQPPGSRAEANGFLSSVTLCPLHTAPRHRLRTDAARAFDALSRARQAATGKGLCVTDSYRDYAGQVDVFRRKPGLAATPGRSQHGWGLAVDLCGGVQTFGSEAHRWMQANAAIFGFVHPSWARIGGSKPEAWHWEYAAGR